MRAGFLAMVSHELRMPLTSIGGEATALLDAAQGLDPTEMRQFHRIIMDRADHIRACHAHLVPRAVSNGAKAPS